MNQEQHECVGKETPFGTAFYCTKCSRVVEIVNGVFKVVKPGEDPRIPHTGFTFVGEVNHAASSGG